MVARVPDPAMNRSIFVKCKALMLIGFAAAIVALVASCSEQLDSTVGCPLVCPQQPLPLRDTTIDAPIAMEEVKLAAVAETPPPVTVAASPPAEPVAEAPSLAANPAALKIATLGGPAVTLTRGGKRAASARSAER